MVSPWPPIFRVLEVLLLVWLLKRHLQPGWRWSVSRFWEVWRYGRILVLNETLWSAALVGGGPGMLGRDR